VYNGILVINKPAGISSHGVVARLRRILNEKKIGHGGTLDPMACGVLPVFVGRATRAAGCIQEGGKTYLADMRLGLTTNTQDTTGTVLTRQDPACTRADVEAALSAFRGEISQLPPMYSAVSVGGVRLYRLARQGVEIERAARRVTVYALELCGVRDNGDYILKIDCSKGLYVRTLIDDLGRTLGCGAAMSALCRTRAGIFTLEEAHTLDEIEQLQAEGTLAAQFSCADRLFQAFPEYHADNHNAARLKNGQHVPLPAPEGTVRVYSPEGFLGVAEVTRGVMKLEKSFY
jgi:tRNA pseudouridine55 synthase